MPSSPALRDLRSALGLGLAAGCAEVALRASPLLGLSAVEQLAWLGAGAGLSLALAALLALPLLVLRSAWPRLPALGLTLGGLIGLQALLWYRLELHVNAFLREPRLWGGLLAIALLSGLLGWLADRPLRAVGPWTGRTALLLALAAAVLAQVRGAPPADARPVPEGPDVLIVTLDTTRPDALQPWGAALSTPALQGLADEGVLFEQAVASAPLTESSHLAMLTGIEPARSGVVANGTDFGAQPALVSHAFHDAGYATAAFVAGFPLTARWGWSQGFQVFDDDFGAMPGLHNLSVVRAWDQLTLPGHTLRERTADAVLARTLPWLARQGERPWFCWVHFFDPHGPYEAPAPFAPVTPPPRDGAPLALPAYWPPALRSVTSTAWLTEAYQAELRFTDQQLGRLLDAVRAGQGPRGTLVLVVGDHGESLTEHGYLFDHGDDLYDPSLRVPLIVAQPVALPAGRRVPCQVSTVDVAATLLGAAGLAATGDGRSLLPLARGDEPCAERDAFATTVAGRLMERPPLAHALRGHGRKLVAHADGRSELYALDQDPGELVDLAPERPDEARALRTVLETRVAGAEVQAPAMDAATQEALRALGYVE